jgi:hypothetical protein
VRRRKSARRGWELRGCHGVLGVGSLLEKIVAARASCRDSPRTVSSETGAGAVVQGGSIGTAQRWRNGAAQKENGGAEGGI